MGGPSCAHDIVKHHALVLPFPLQGHIAPLLQLSQHLAACHGFLITFVNTEHNHQRMVKATGNGDGMTSNNGGINMVGLPDGLPADAERKASDMGMVVVSMQEHMPPLLEQLISQINQSSCPITCIIADIFMLWAPHVAKKAQIPALIGFHTSSIVQFSFLYHIPFLLASGQVHPDGTAKASLEKFTGIPGVVDIPVSAATWLLGSDPKTNEDAFKTLGMTSTLVEEFDVLLFNSFTDLEKEALEGLVEGRSRVAAPTTPKQLKMLPIGPCLLFNDARSSKKDDTTVITRDFGGILSQADMGCMEWLEGRPPNSVLYIAFGSTAQLTNQQLYELALGVEASNVPFLWVLREDLLTTSSADLQDTEGGAGVPKLPQGFMERTREHAYFTPWAPQTAVLAHPAVGAFLSHGGWNSTLEAIAMGVPMLVMPYFWDQKFHAEHVVEQWKIGLPVKLAVVDRSERRQEAGRREVERLVRSVMKMKSDDGGAQQNMRERAGELSRRARHAVLHCTGTSYSNIQDLVQFVGRLRQAGAAPSCDELQPAQY